MKMLSPWQIVQLVPAPKGLLAVYKDGKQVVGESCVLALALVEEWSCLSDPGGCGRCLAASECRDRGYSDRVVKAITSDGKFLDVDDSENLAGFEVPGSNDRTLRLIEAL